MLIVNIFTLKRTSKNNPEYKNLRNWLTYLHGEKYSKTIIKECGNKRKQLYSKPKEKQNLFKDTIAVLSRVSSLKDQAIAIYERNNNSETSAKFENLKKSLIYYTYPDYILEAIKSILISISVKY
jgi:hypothetical protein